MEFIQAIVKSKSICSLRRELLNLLPLKVHRNWNRFLFLDKRRQKTFIYYYYVFRVTKLRYIIKVWSFFFQLPALVKISTLLPLIVVLRTSIFQYSYSYNLKTHSGQIVLYKNRAMPSFYGFDMKTFICRTKKVINSFVHESPHLSRFSLQKFPFCMRMDQKNFFRSHRK